MDEINWGRGSSAGQSSSRYVDMVIKQKRNDDEIQFTNIQREETSVLNEYVHNVLIPAMKRDIKKSSKDESSTEDETASDEDPVATEATDDTDDDSDDDENFVDAEDDDSEEENEVAAEDTCDSSELGLADVSATNMPKLDKKTQKQINILDPRKFQLGVGTKAELFQAASGLYFYLVFNKLSGPLTHSQQFHVHVECVLHDFRIAIWR